MGSPSLSTLRTQAAKKGPIVSGPKLPTPKATVSRSVFLTEEAWDELADAARFHSETFKRLGSKEGVSRNDMIDAFLEWALGSYWEDKGGRPTSEEDWERKLVRHADALKKAQK